VAVKRILVIRLSAIGDVALAIPVLQNACNSNPATEFYFLCKPFAAKIMPTISNLKIIEWHTEQQNVWALAKTLRALNFDCIIDLHSVLRTNLLRLALPFHNWFIFDKARAGKNQFLKDKKNEVVHTAIRYQNAFIKAGIKLNPQHKFQFNDEIDSTTLQFVAGIQGNKKLIGIAAYAAHAQKTIPDNLLHRIISNLNENVILFGGPNDQQKIDELCAKNKHVHHCLHLNFKQQIDVMKYLDAMLAVDSANMHLAALYAVPLVSIWGATHPSLGFAPVTFAAHIAVQIPFTELPCRPCSVFGKKPCSNKENLACFNRIDVEEVLQALNSILKRK
jgi:ADP-heptose:LPS heptosyltransferase